MKLLVNYLSAEKTRIANEILTADFKPETFYRAQGEISRINDLLNLPELLTSYNIKEV